jgi:hypothetical protein
MPIIEAERPRDLLCQLLLECAPWGQTGRG